MIYCILDTSIQTPTKKVRVRRLRSEQWRKTRYP